MISKSTGLEIAITGISGRFPKSKTIESFWENLINGLELTSVFPNSTPKDTDFDKPNQTIKAGAVLDDVELFDASFFGFNPREAETIDPQHRLFLECAWEALENAGYNSEIEERPIGVYAGVGMGTYLLYNLTPNRDLMESTSFLQTLVGVDKDYLPTRVSYKLNLKGPSVSVGTACSSSLVAVHLACQSLLSGECDMALAAGVSVKVPQNELTLSPEEIVSPDGHCKAFDAKANGTIGGNGIGVVVLKRLEDAIADRDRIYAVIKGSAINNDGAVKVGYTAPSEDGQARVIKAAQIMAEVEPETITYLETHGTGTALGDPIEIAAMTQAFRARTDKKSYCAIGSVKTNVGHLDAAAGIVGFIKTVLALDSKLLPPMLNFDTPNPQIDFENSPFYVNTKLSEWRTNGTPRRAGVSSFGFGGTNAHVILEENPVGEASSPSRARQLLLLSAKTPSALETATTNLANHLKQHPELNLADVVYTLQIGRKAFEYRRMVVVEDLDDAVNALESFNPQRVFTQFQEPSDRSVVFMFPGQGAQYANMARELYQSEAIFRQECDRCCELLQPQLGLDLRQLLYPREEDTQKAAQQLQQTAITQPALFIVEYALAKLWMSWGVRPRAAIGHSIGEYVAACLAGVFSLEDALALVATRGRLMQQLPEGAMLSVSLSAEQVQPLLNEKLSLAANNAPTSCVVSGSVAAIEQLEHLLAGKGINSRRLHTSHAFHSQMVEPIIQPFTLVVQRLNLNPPTIPFISNVTGTWITASEATDPSYWAKHLRQGVQFTPGIAELLHDEQAIFLEVGPGRTLSTLTRQQASARVVFSSLRHPQEELSDVAFVLNTLGKLWLHGVQVDWSGFYAEEKRDRIPLPTYPFERQRYWIDPPHWTDRELLPPVTSPGTSDIADWFYIPTWKRSLVSVANREKTIRTCWLVFIDECSLGLKLAQRLQTDSQNVITVNVGSTFAKTSDRAYTLNPSQPHDFDILISSLLAQNQLPEAIVHLWNVTPPSSTQSGWEESDLLLDRGFYSLLYLAQAIRKQKLTLHISVISNNMQAVTGEETLLPHKATVLGLVNVIPQECPNINCQSIDVVLPRPESLQEEKLIDQLRRELVVPTTERTIAYRGNYHWVQTFAPLRLDEPKPQVPRLREKGVYLITGGLGAIGLVLAEYLARTVQAKLILIGRSAFPAKDEWEQWLATHDQHNSISRKIRQIQELESLGAEVLLISADVGNLEQMQQAIAQSQKCFGSPNGAIHAAGVLDTTSLLPIEKTTYDNCQQHFYPKVQGLLVLEKVLPKDLDFCLLMSSLSCVLGGVGTVAYSAANLFMDAFVHQHNQTSPIPWISVNWDIWKVGQQNSSTMSSADAIPPEAGVNALQRILFQRELERIVVSTKDLQARINRWIQVDSLRADSSEPDKLSSLHPRPHLSNSYIAPRNLIEQTITNIWQEILGVKEVGIHDNFFELGGHSLIGTHLISKLNDEFTVELPTVSIFEAPTVSLLAQLLSPEPKESSALIQRRSRGEIRRQKNARTQR